MVLSRRVKQVSLECLVTRDLAFLRDGKPTYSRDEDLGDVVESSRFTLFFAAARVVRFGDYVPQTSQFVKTCFAHRRIQLKFVLIAILACAVLKVLTQFVTAWVETVPGAGLHKGVRVE